VTPIPRLREEPLCFDVFAEPWQEGAVAAPGVELARAVPVQVASRYADGRGCTLIAALPAGWSGAERAVDGTLEAFVLEGELTVPGRTLRSGGFLQVPKGAGPVELSSGAGARVVFFWHATLAVLHSDGWRVTSVWDEPWTVTQLQQVPAGMLHKTLRLPDARASDVAGSAAGFLRLVLPGPGWFSPAMEKHGCWEENILLRGDMLMPMPGRGVLRPGTNLSNPADYWHGPMTTKGGALFLVHCDAPMDVVYRPHPGGEETLRAYLETAPWA
jgi:hypothetical protein